jgi:hypothetical protein
MPEIEPAGHDEITKATKITKITKKTKGYFVFFFVNLRDLRGLRDTSVGVVYGLTFPSALHK